MDHCSVLQAPAPCVRRPRDRLAPLPSLSSPETPDPLVRAKGPLETDTAIRSKRYTVRVAPSSSRTRARAIHELIAARRKKSAQRVGSGAVGCFMRARPSSAPLALTSATDPKRTAGREYALSVSLASSVAKHTFRDPASCRGPQISSYRRTSEPYLISPRRRTSEPYLMSARDAAIASVRASSMSDDFDDLPPGREYALSMCLASAVAKHTFRDKAATRGPQISPQRMSVRPDDADGSTSRVWTSVAPTAARDESLPAGGREYALSMCMASAVAKHTFRDKAATRGPQISPQRMSHNDAASSKSRAMPPLAASSGGGSHVPWEAPLPLCALPPQDPLLQESIAKFEFRKCGGKQISPSRHQPA